MKIKAFFLYPYEILLKKGPIRHGTLINIIDHDGKSGWGEIAPLPKWSHESLDDSMQQLHQKQQKIMHTNWTSENCLQEIEKLNLLPSLSFGLESALLSILNPISNYSISTSALLMGSPDEIMLQAKLRYQDGYASAKLKVSNLSFVEAAEMIHRLKDKFRLRIDVNRAWKTSESLHFFEQFPLNAFDYVEEPFENPHELGIFPHPLAIDESYPQDIKLEQLESFPTLKALIYKPTIQGGLSNCLPLYEWTKKKGLQLILSSSFESDLGLANIASIAHRLSLLSPVGLGTYDYLTEYFCKPELHFADSFLHIPAQIKPQLTQIHL